MHHSHCHTHRTVENQTMSNKKDSSIALLRRISAAVSRVERERGLVLYNEVFGAPRYHENPHRTWNVQRVESQSKKLLRQLVTAMDLTSAHDAIGALFLYADTCEDFSLAFVAKCFDNYVKRLQWWDDHYNDFETWVMASFSNETIDQCRCRLTGRLCRLPILIDAQANMYDICAIEQLVLQTKWSLNTLVICVSEVADVVFHWKCKYMVYLSNSKFLWETSYLHHCNFLSRRQFDVVSKAVGGGPNDADAMLKKMYSCDTGLFLESGTLNPRYTLHD